MWSAKERFDAFADWFATFGVKEDGFSEAHARALREALPGISRILNLYFLRPDLQAAYPAPWDAAQRSQFAHRLQQQRVELELTAEEISLFIEFAAAQRELIEKMCFLYQHFGRPRMSDPSIYATDDPRAGATALETRKMLDWLIEEDAIRPVDHFVGHFGEDRARLEDFGKCSVPGLSPKKNFAFVKAIREAMAGDPPPATVNFAGYLGAPSGMGESARSMLATLRNAGQDIRVVTLPHPRTQATGLPVPPVLFGWPGSRAAVSITVANADSASQAEHFLPRTYWASKNVGYWVWETEALPPKFAEAEARFDEIWTPSHFSAAAIRRTVSRPVRVLPHTLDFATLDLATADRARFGLPQAGTLYGFMFDPQSVLERKNVAGLIRAFRQAFRDDDDCYLVLKVNGKARGAYDYETVRAQAGGGRILFVESTLGRDETCDFMKSLDVYVSLHRSEGFGLTCAEAMALGLPVVATGYSGNLQFMDAHNSLLVPATVVETERPFGAYPAGTRWADPDVEAAAALLRTLLERERREDLGTRARAAVRESLAVERIGELLVQFKDGLLAPGRRNEDEGAANGRAGGEA
jgi:glycosyltransferase involved in cell wall biosynthesis